MFPWGVWWCRSPGECSHLYIYLPPGTSMSERIQIACTCEYKLIYSHIHTYMHIIHWHKLLSAYAWHLYTTFTAQWHYTHGHRLSLFKYEQLRTQVNQILSFYKILLKNTLRHGFWASTVALPTFAPRSHRSATSVAHPIPFNPWIQAQDLRLRRWDRPQLET